MHLRTIARRLLAATTLSLAVAASPAFAQTADLSVAFTLRGTNTTITWGGAETYRATITNNGPTHVTSFDFAAAIDAKLTIVSVTGCTATVTGQNIACTVTPASPGLVSGASTVVDVAVVYEVPATLDPTTSVCPSTTPVDFSSTATISNALQGTTPVTDAAGNNGPVASDNTLANWVDLEVTSVDGPPTASEGQSIQYTVVVTNNGPCNATNAFVDFVAPNVLGVPTNLTGDCLNPASDFYVFESAGCDLGAAAWARDTTKTFTATYTVGTYPSDLIHAGLPIDVAISADQGDPLGDNDAVSMLTQVDLSDNDGCSTGGAGTLLGLLSLVALRLGRRRAS